MGKQGAGRGGARQGQRSAEEKRREFLIFLAVMAGVLLLLLAWSWISGRNRDPEQRVRGDEDSPPSLPVVQPEQPMEPERRKSILEDQIGAFYDVYPTDPDEQIIVRILEQAFTDDPPGVRPAKWIDELPDTPPPSPAPILPALGPEVLFHSKPTVDAHWPAFQQRCPKTAAFFLERGLRPRMEVLPGDDQQAYGAELNRRFAWTPGELSFPHEDSAELKASPPEAARMFQEYLNLMVYLDFLHARGGEAGKGLARGLTYHVRSLRLNLIHLAGDEKVEWREPEDYDRVMAAEATRARQLYTDLTIELFWAQWWPEGDGLDRVAHLGSQLTKHSRERLRYGKWIINHQIPCSQDNRELHMINRENSYFYYGDHGGSLVFYHIVSPEEDPKHLMPSFLKRFGQERGGALYEEYAAAKRRVLQRQQSPTSESGKLQ